MCKSDDLTAAYDKWEKTMSLHRLVEFKAAYMEGYRDRDAEVKDLKAWLEERRAEINRIERIRKQWDEVPLKHCETCRWRRSDCIRCPHWASGLPEGEEPYPHWEDGYKFIQEQRNSIIQQLHQSIGALKAQVAGKNRLRMALEEIAVTLAPIGKLREIARRALDWERGLR